MQNAITVRKKSVVKLLAVVLGGFIVLGTIADLWLSTYPGPTTKEILHRFSLVRDLSAPSWASSLLLFACAIALILTAYVECRCEVSHSRGWWVLAATFVLLSMDEIAMFHELSGTIVRRVLPSTADMGGVFHYSWVLVAIPFLLLFAVFMSRWFFSLSRTTQIRFAIAGIIFVSGAVGLEMVGAALDAATPENGFWYFVLTSIEESLELLGASLFLLAILDRFSESEREFTISFSSGDAA